jgi:hypothetical protein
LLFDFVNSSASYFQGANNFGVGYEFGLRGAVYPVVNGPPGPGEGIELTGPSPVIQIKPMSGIAVIATTTGSIPAVPEASTWAMLLLGFAGLGFAGYRRMNWRGLEGPAAS